MLWIQIVIRQKQPALHQLQQPIDQLGLGGGGVGTADQIFPNLLRGAFAIQQVPNILRTRREPHMLASDPVA